jgi:hypothetical protein
MAWTIAKKVDAKVTDKVAFFSLWDAIKAAPGNGGGKELPHKAMVLDVNKARVGFKHNGNLPANTDATKFETYTEQFLTDSCTEFLGLNFNDVSLFDLIQHKEGTAHLRKAEKAIAVGDASTALEECAAAYYCLGRPMATLLPRLRNDLSRAVGRVRPDGRIIEPAVRVLEDNVNGLRDFTVATSLGVSLPDLLRFRFVIPGLIVSGTGCFQFQWIGGRQPKHDDAVFALRFLTDYGLAMQDALAGLTDADRKLLFGADA